MRKLFGGGPEKQNINPFQRVVPDLTKSFPKVQLIESEQERPTKERIPSYAGKDLSETQPEELVWLTSWAIKNRLRVLLQTHPVFNKETTMVGKVVMKDRRVVETAKRVPVEDQEVVRALEEMGFPFVSYKGKTVMLVDATIPAKDNVLPKKITFEDVRVDNVGRWSRGILASSSPHKIGFRPPKKSRWKFAYVVPISLEEIFKIHREPLPVDVIEFGGADETFWGRTKDISTAQARDWDRIKGVLVHMATQDKGLAKRFNEIRMYRDKDSIRQALGKKFLVFELLKELGLTAMLQSSKFPYEPSYLISKNKTKKEGKSATTLSDLAHVEDLEASPYIMPSTFLLEDFVWLFGSTKFD